MYLAVVAVGVVCGQEYQGAYLGKLNTYAHQVTGEVYAIDEHTFFIKSFFYDGLGQGACVDLVVKLL